MIVIFASSIIALFLTYLESRRIIKGGMKVGFVIVTCIAAIRYNYGNDYISYYNDYKEASVYSLDEILLYNDFFKDFGWVLFCKLFEPLGFFPFIALISTFCNCVVYKFIKENVPISSYWLAVFIYLFTFDMYVLQMSMIRQGFVIALFLLAFHFLKKGKLLFPIFIALLGVTLHKSSVVILPFILLYKFFPFYRTKMISFIIFALFVVFFLSKNILNDLIGGVFEIQLMSTYVSDYAFEDGNSFGIRAMFELLPFFISLFYIANSKKRIYSRSSVYCVFLSTITELVFPFTMIIHLISRVSFYFEIFLIAAIPISYASIKNINLRCILLSLFIILSLYVYFDRFLNSIYTSSYMNYQTIFSVL